MDKDNKTLVLRRRYNLSSEGIIVERYPSPFRYLRLRPGQEKVESHSFTLPVTSITLFHTPGEGGLNVESAQRLAIEIGFYDEDLRALILGVVDMVEKLGCDGSAVSDLVSSDASAMRLYYRFFGGFTIAGLYTTENISFFRNSVTSDGDEILMPTMHQSLNGEQVLQIEVDNVSIPYKSNYPPLTDELTLSETEPAGITTVLTKFDVNDTILELGFKIINNTDHDIWVCDGYERSNGSIRYFDRFMDNDNKTLVLRRRYSLSSEGIIVERYPSHFRYLRLRPGQEKVESHSFSLPVTSTSPLFQRSGSGGLNVDSAQRLVIEIGFYDENLRALILDVVDVAERIGWDDSAIRDMTLGASARDLRLYYRFFGGFKIARLFTSKNITYFRDSVTSDGDEILMPPMDKALNGEHVLRIEFDNLSIPFSLF
jgi:hypothetical protein